MLTAKKNALWGIIPAAGIGSRFGGDIPKQYLKINGISILEHSINRIAQVKGVKGIVVALNAKDDYWQEISLPVHIDIKTVSGGENRCDSVYNALKWLTDQPSDQAWALVHDAARPCVNINEINQLIDVVGDDENGGMLALRARDTMKRSNGDIVIKTVDREGLWHAQTPQLFPVSGLFNALQDAREKGITVTDDSQAMEFAGFKPRLVEGSISNIKVTRPQDLELAEFFCNTL